MTFYSPLLKHIQKYIFSSGHNVANPEILWDSFEESKPDDVPDTVKTVMDNWTYKPGYPLLSLTQNGINITISQVSTR